MYGFNLIIRNNMKVSFFIDKNDKIYHWQYLSGFNYDLSEFEVELLKDYGVDFLIKTVKKMRVYEHLRLNGLVELVRFE